MLTHLFSPAVELLEISRQEFPPVAENGRWWAMPRSPVPWDRMGILKKVSVRRTLDMAAYGYITTSKDGEQGSDPETQRQQLLGAGWPRLAVSGVIVGSVALPDG